MLDGRWALLYVYCHTFIRTRGGCSRTGRGVLLYVYCDMFFVIRLYVPAVDTVGRDEACASDRRVLAARHSRKSMP